MGEGWGLFPKWGFFPKWGLFPHSVGGNSSLPGLELFRWDFAAGSALSSESLS